MSSLQWATRACCSRHEKKRRRRRGVSSGNKLVSGTTPKRLTISMPVIDKNQCHHNIELSETKWLLANFIIIPLLRRAAYGQGQVIEFYREMAVYASQFVSLGEHVASPAAANFAQLYWMCVTSHLMKWPPNKTWHYQYAGHQISFCYSLGQFHLYLLQLGGTRETIWEFKEGI